MPTHLYCLLPAGNDVAPPASAVRVLAAAGLLAWVSDAPSPRLPRDVREAARATIEHDRVIGAALGHGVTPVPASLTDPYESDDAARSDIARYANAIASALARVKGKVEMTTIIAVHDAPPAPDGVGPGRAYLEQLRSAPHRAANAADLVERRLTDVAGPAARRPDGARVALSHLIAGGEIERYREAALACAANDFRIVVDGPRAPYSFAAFSPGRGVSELSSTAA